MFKRFLMLNLAAARYRESIIGIFAHSQVSLLTDHLNLVEPEVIVPQEVINIPDFIGKEDVDLSCYSVRNLPNGGRFSSPGWDGKLALSCLNF